MEEGVGDADGLGAAVAVGFGDGLVVGRGVWRSRVTSLGMVFGT